VIRNSIVAKLWITIVAMVVVVLALLSILLQQFLDNYIYQQQSQQLVRVAESVQTLMSSGQSAGTATGIADKLISLQDSHIRLQTTRNLSGSPSLERVYDSFSSSQKQDFLANEPVVVRVIAKDKNPEHDAAYIYAQIPGSNGIGMIAVSQQMSALHEPITLMRNLILFSVGLSILFTTALAFIVSKNISRPLVQMNKAAEGMALGNFKSQIKVTTIDEVGRLGKTFNGLAAELDKTIQALSMEKEQLTSILSSLTDGVAAADLEGNITLANPPALRRFIALATNTGKSSGPRRLPEDLMMLMVAVVKTRRPITREFMWNGRDIVVTMIPLYESDGEDIRGVVSLQRDVTEERRLDRLRKDFVANVSHELRTPLSMMQGYSEALLDDFGDDYHQRIELTEIIHDEAIRMKRLVNDLLDLAQLESGYFQMNMEDFNMADLSHRVVRKFSALAQEQGVLLSHSLTQKLVLVHGDEDRIEQVLTNLLDNAIRHCRAGDEVALHLQAVEGYARIQIRDTGVGIVQEDLPYIWERFYKADKARTRGDKPGGTGLGLAITRSIVLEHGGDIAVDSTVGVGTVFTVSIPLSDTGKSPAQE